MISVFKKLDNLKLELDKFRPIDESLLSTIQEKLRIDWTYNSNAIEGNTLTYGETDFFLREGLTSEGKPLKDYLEAKNHAESIDLLHDYIRQKRKLSEGLIKELHALLLKGIEFTYARGMGGKIIKKTLTPGKYKTRPNHVLTTSGQVHHCTSPLHVLDEMEKLIKWLEKAKGMHPIEKAAIFHYEFVAIHPFDDGNGRLARLLMNLIIMTAGFPPCVVRNSRRKRYLECLEIADIEKDKAPFVTFIAAELLQTMEGIINVLAGKISGESKRKNTTLNKIQRENLILKVIGKEHLSIGQMLELIPQIKRPTLKKDLGSLVKKNKIRARGKGRGVVYFL